MMRIRCLLTILLSWLIVIAVHQVVSEETVVTDAILDADDVDSSPDPDDHEVISLDENDISEKFRTSPEIETTDNSTFSKDGLDEPVKRSSNTTPERIVESSLESMSDEELKAICTDRGFVISIEGEEGLSQMTHADYVEAATKCLSLEKEMNAVIAENPDLAAELDLEIERMRLEKERLEQERDAILAEKALLEEQLRNAGVDPSSIAPVPSSLTITNASSVDEVLRESFVRLFDRVGCDLQLVGGLIMYALKPMGGPIQLLWRYTSPSIEGMVRQCITFANNFISAKQLETMHQVVLLQYKTVKNLMAPIIGPVVAGVTSLLRMLNQKPEIQQVRRILGAFFGPLTESLFSGWKLVEPNVTMAVENTSSWLRRLAKDSLSQGAN
jgi:hypothetical protein